ncbi:senescence/dehydration-associated protein At4g35985, chloroplastic-like [Andrographis paniculata]|uniref:senescence/dehydration-associated protein At4g35985, chloroplastic-like n=1 Tax=Andrographis paniculata TaxID=175694 RepID=UPI0021E94CBD|nr:senescence/dehydration-associated protein At4g35985, chloroplastic-like [Andrographis paniculata]
MGCCGRSRTLSPTKSTSPAAAAAAAVAVAEEDKSNVKHEVLATIRGCKVHLMDEGEALELAAGDLEVLRISDGGVPLATVVKVGDELQWPLTKDEPVVKLDSRNYLFSLPVKEEMPLSYGVSFSGTGSGELKALDSFLEENSVFTRPAPSSERRKGEIDWKTFAPAVEDYNGVLAKAIAGGTGQIVRGIFTCTNAYANQVHKGGEAILIRAANEKNTQSDNNNRRDIKRSTSSINKTLRRVRKVSKMTEKMSKAMVDVIGVASGSVIGPAVRSQAGKKILSMVPGEVLLASLDGINKILDAAEAAERQAMAATSGALSRIVTDRYGESAGEATEDALAAAGHVAGTAWNVVKIRRAINPATSASGVLKNAAKPAATRS